MLERRGHAGGLDISNVGAPGAPGVGKRRRSFPQNMTSMTTT